MHKRKDNRMKALPALLMSTSTLLTGTAHAYIGPGLGAGAAITILGLGFAFLLAVIAFVYYPIRRALRRRNRHTAMDPSDS